ncbi:MAG: hypothetical protein KIT83_03625 [Bryobacterales bacterium]|nr:hypothetical protein [Bryobacterales bacterium]
MATSPPLWRARLPGHPLFVFDHYRFEPFANQPNDPLIGDPVCEKQQHPLVIDLIERRRDMPS